MNRRSFIQSSLGGSVLAGVAVLPGTATTVRAQAGNAAKQQILELRHYQIKKAANRDRVADYLKNAFIPGANRAGIKPVGVFYPMPEEKDYSIYRLTAFDSMDPFLSMGRTLSENADYLEAAQDYLASEKSNPAYQRIETTLMQAFDGYPTVKTPRKGERIFELRTYESHNEMKAYLKIEMFNEAELGIFKKVHLDGVFYGRTIAGGRMPRLTYMLAYTDKAEREKNWKAFLGDPDWDELKTRERYKDTVSNISATFLVPAPFSQI